MRSWSRSGRQAVLIAGLASVALVATLSGCTSSTTHAVAPSSSTAPAPTPSAPRTYGLDCSDVVSAKLLASIDSTISASDGSINGGDEVAPPSPSDLDVTSFTPAIMTRFNTQTLIGSPGVMTMLAAASQGYFGCSWRGQTTSFDIGVLSDGTSAFQEFRKKELDGSQPELPSTITVTGFGPGAFAGCIGGDSAGPPCELDFLYERAWIRVGMLPSDVATRSFGGARDASQLTEVARSARAGIEAAGALPGPFTVAPSAWSSVTSCQQIVPSDTASDGDGGHSFDETDEDDDLLAAAADRSGGLECVDSDLVVAALPGAGSVEPIDYDYSSYKPPVTMSLTNVTEARYVCTVQGQDCWAEGVVDGALVVASGGTQSQDAAELGHVGSVLASL